MSKLQPVYYVSGMQIYLLSTRQILQSKLRVEGNKSDFTFYNKSCDAVLLATPNFLGNIQIVRACIFKYNISNSMSLIIKSNSKTLYYCFGLTFDKAICHVFNNIEDVKKIYFLTQKHVCCSCIFGKIY